jgi:hypothetical protein
MQSARSYVFFFVRRADASVTGTAGGGGAQAGSGRCLPLLFATL